MSDMRPKGKTIKINGKEYGIKFTLGVIDDIQDKFDIAIADVETIFANGRDQIKNLIALLTIMINEDIESRRDNGENIEPLTERYIARHLDMYCVEGIKDAILGAMQSGILSDGEDEEEEITTTPNA